MNEDQPTWVLWMWRVILFVLPVVWWVGYRWMRRYFNRLEVQAAKEASDDESSRAR